MSEQLHTDAKLIAMLQGSPSDREIALKHIFTDMKLEAIIVNKIKSKGGSLEDAKNAYQNGFLIFYKHLREGAFEGRSSLKTYFIGICIRCWIDEIKKSYNKRTTLTNDIPTLDKEYQHTPDVVMIDEERKNTLRAILDKLGKPCREVIMLHKEGYKDAEIKEILKLEPHEVIRKIRYRCMNKLMNWIKKDASLLSILKGLKYG